MCYHCLYVDWLTFVTRLVVVCRLSESVRVVTERDWCTAHGSGCRSTGFNITSTILLIIVVVSNIIRVLSLDHARTHARTLALCLFPVGHGG